MLKKAETIYTMREKAGQGKRPSRPERPARHSGMPQPGVLTACYISMNGIAMPALHYKSRLCLAL